MPKKETKVDLDKLHELALKKNTVPDIAKQLDVSESTIKRLIKQYFPNLEQLGLFTDNKKDVFKSLQHLAAKHLVSKIPLANVKDLTYLVAILEDKINLMEGKSSHNVAIGIRIEHLVSQKEKILAELRDKGVPENQLEEEFKKIVAVPNPISVSLKELGLDLPSPSTIGTGSQ